MKMRLKPTFYYNFISLLKSAGVFYGIITAVIVFLFITTAANASIASPDGNQDGTFGGYGFAACITVFVFGICTVRDTLRLGIQHGVGRRSSFIAQTLAFTSISAIMAVAGELLTAAAQAVAASRGNMRVADLYQMMYLNSYTSISAVNHIKQALFTLVFLLLASFAGMFISLVFYRLNKKWTVIVATGVPITLFFLPSIIIGTLNSHNIAVEFMENVAKAFSAFMDNPTYVVIAAVACSLLLVLFNWLLTRRAPL